MKKLVFFIPAIIFTIYYGFALSAGMGAIHTIVLVYLALFWIAGIFLSKTMFWGGLLGFIPGACFIYMGTQETGQIYKETPFGVIILLYYAACILYCVYKRSKPKDINTNSYGVICAARFPSTKRNATVLLLMRSRSSFVAIKMTIPRAKLFRSLLCKEVMWNGGSGWN